MQEGKPMNTVAFKKINGSWYADLPEYLAQGGTLDDCLMVCGVPEMLELLAKGATSMKLQVSETWLPGFYAVLSRRFFGTARDKDCFGLYLASLVDHAFQVDESDPIQTGLINLTLGLCPVNAWFFGGRQPDTIYVRKG